MLIQQRSSSHRRRIGGSYIDKVLGHAPTAYWPLNEASGAVATELVNGWNGAYTGVTLGQPGIGDGETCPLFGGATDFVDVFSTALSAAFSGDEGSALLWCKVFNVGVWSDGGFRYAVRYGNVANEYVAMTKRSTNDTMRTERSGAAFKALNYTPFSSTAWFPCCVTWSLSAGVDGELKFYVNGVHRGTETGIGAFGGVLENGHVVIGAQRTTPTFPWYGWLAHAAVWAGTILTLPQIVDLSVV